jgi:hypothetical protein
MIRILLQKFLRLDFFLIKINHINVSTATGHFSRSETRTSVTKKQSEQKWVWKKKRLELSSRTSFRAWSLRAKVWPLLD